MLYSKALSAVLKGNFSCASKIFKQKFHCELSPVKPGRLLIRSAVDMRVNPASFTFNQTGCKAEVLLASQSPIEQSEMQTLNAQLNVTVHEFDTHNDLVVDVPDSLARRSLCVDIAIPHHYSVKILGEGTSGVQLSKLECDSVDVKLEDGECKLLNMKALNTEIKGIDVDLIFEKPFTGNLKASIRNGNVTADKLQGQEMFIETLSGNIQINALYAATSALQCTDGDIEIGNCHGSARTETNQGNIAIRSVDGSLKARATDGDLDIHLSSYTNVDLLSSEGHVNITVPESLCSAVTIDTEQLDVGDSLILDIKSRDTKSAVIEGTIGDIDVGSPAPSQTLNVKAGSVSLGVMDWITAQKLKMNSDFGEMS